MHASYLKSQLRTRWGTFHGGHINGVCVCVFPGLDGSSAVLYCCLTKTFSCPLALSKLDEQRRASNQDVRGRSQPSFPSGFRSELQGGQRAKPWKALVDNAELAWRANPPPPLPCVNHLFQVYAPDLMMVSFCVALKNEVGGGCLPDTPPHTHLALQPPHRLRFPRRCSLTLPRCMLNRY